MFKDICEKTGGCDVHFGSIFRKFEGCTPKEYRAKISE